MNGFVLLHSGCVSQYDASQHIGDYVIGLDVNRAMPDTIQVKILSGVSVVELTGLQVWVNENKLPAQTFYSGKLGTTYTFSPVPANASVVVIGIFGNITIVQWAGTVT